MDVVTANRSTDSTICVKNRAVSTEISFRRNAGDIPAVSLYGNLIGHGELFFETKQTFICDCQNFQCSGTFRIAYDEELSPAISSYTNGSSILQALRNMETFLTTGYTVTPISDYADGPLCADYQTNNFTFVFRGMAGNAPRVGLWSSVNFGESIAYFSTNDTFAPLRLVSDDGRDDHVKLCNGIGECDFTTGTCSCPFGWKFDANIGPCGGLDVATSDWGGVGRCPGIIPASQVGVLGVKRKTLDNVPNDDTRVVVSIDPIPLNASQSTSTYVPDEFSTIRSYKWLPNTVNGPIFDLKSEIIVVNLTSSTSAGPVLIDSAKDQVIFVDANPSYPFIGKASLLSQDINNFTRWYTYDNSASASPYMQIASLAFDARAWRRVLYWSVPAGMHADDGDIYFAYLDDVNPTVYQLSTIIGATSNTFSPMALAIHYNADRLYWTDRLDSSAARTGVIRSCSLTNIGEHCWEDHVLSEVEGVQLGLNFSDIVIDFNNNSTMYLVDNAHDNVRVITIGLALPNRYNNKSQGQDPDVYELNRFYHSPRMVFNSTMFPMTDVPHMIFDPSNNLVVMADVGYERVAFGLTIPNPANSFPWGIVYSGRNGNNIKTRRIVGMIFDFGYGPLRKDFILDCYGRGICAGLAGAFECQCLHGFYGDCQAASCPKDKAWFHEPHIHNVAHDIDVECSNAGLCDRSSGECNCFEGFEGHACQRRTCIGSSFASNPQGTGSSCFNRGRCMTMRELSLYHKDSSLEEAPVIYGSQAGDPTTWDADVLQGCKADEYGYFFGQYNVSSPRDIDVLHYDCPMGFNTRLLGAPFVNISSMNSTQTHYFETQQIICRGETGYFRLSFRGKKSSKLNANMTSAELQSALEGITSLGAVSVSMDEYQLCVPYRAVSYTTVTFLSQVGQVAMLKIDENYLKGRKIRLEIERVHTSDPGEVYECSGHGNCDYRTGHCHCYPGYASSDGNGNPGTRGDCGFNVIV
jgi:hypothetical protein